MAWSTNPHYGYFDDFGTTYSGRVLAINNMVVCSSEICVYTTLLVLYFRATRMGGGATSGADKSQSRKESRVCRQTGGERAVAIVMQDFLRFIFKLYALALCI